MSANVDGILLIDKSPGKTSHQVVEEVRRLLGTQKVGHTGTLDPDATGLLVLCVGKALKLVEFMEPLSKEYLVTVRLGIITDTLDMSGKVLAETPVPPLTDEDLRRALKPFEGETMQQPPAISAIKVGGERSYALARRGVGVLPPLRRIQIHAIELLDWVSPRVTLKVSCSKGTYIRSLARDLGERLGCGGAVEQLRRSVVGEFTVEKSVSVEGLDRDRLLERLLAPESGLGHIPVVDLDPEAARAFGQGKLVPLSIPLSGLLRVHSRSVFLGVGEVSPDGQLHAKKVLAPVN